MPISDEQREERRSFLGASDIPAILGFNEWSKPWHVFWSKMPKEEWPEEYKAREEKPESKSIAFGNALEDYVMKYMAAYLTKVGTLEEAVNQYGYKQNTRYVNGIFAANLDGELSRFIKRNKIYEVPAILEAKTTGFNRQPLEVWGRALTLDIPVRVAIQTQAQMICTGWNCTWIGLLSGHDASGIKMYEILKDGRLQNTIKEKGELFWNKYVLPKKEPPKELTHV